MTKYEANKEEGIITITTKEEATNYIDGSNFYTNDNSNNTIIQTKNRKSKLVANISITSITIPAHLNITEEDAITIEFTDKTEFIHEVVIDEDNIAFDLGILGQVNSSIVYDDDYFVEFVRSVITDIYNDETILDLLEKYEESQADDNNDAGNEDNTVEDNTSNEGE